MKRVGAACAATAVIVAGSAYIATSAQASTTSARIGAAPSIPRGATRAAAPAGSQALSLDVTLKPRDEAALTAYVSDVSQPGSAYYHHYLSKGQFAQAFGPSAETIDATEAALKAQGLTVDSVSPDGLTISVSTTVAKAASAFNTSFSGYRLADGRAAYANNSAPQLPASVAGQVQGVVGLNNLTSFTNDLVGSGRKAVVAPTGAAGVAKVKAATGPNYAAPTVCSGLTESLNGNGYEDGRDYYSPASLDSVYGVGGSLAAGDDGQGVSVGVFELEAFDPTGLKDYESCLGISTPVTVEKVDGGATTPADAASNVGFETALDVDTISGIAPGVSIVDYQGPDASGATDTNVLDVYQKMVTDDTVKVISTSWGTCEDGYTTAADFDLLSSENTVFQEAAAEGQTVLAASGDEGSTACAYLNSDNTILYPSLASSVNVGDPASQPYVTGVGGTSIDGLGGDLTTTTWNNSTAETVGSTVYGYGGASTGGVSEYWSLPDGGYQAGFTGAGYSPACSASTLSTYAQGDTCRQVPDVSASADPDHGYLLDLYDSAGDPAGDYVFIYGGTSAAAPVWAAISAIADAGKDCAGNGALGFINPGLYATAEAGTSGVLTDVTTGNNVLAYSGYTGTDYAAGTGYDLATGLGSPVASGVVKALCNSVASTKASYFQPITPVRVLDSRNGTGGLKTKLAKGQTYKLTLGGVAADGIPAGATAVVVNVTVTNTTASGFITVSPAGSPVPNASNVNFVKGETQPNLVVAPLGTGGAIDITNGGSQTGPTDVIADVSGYFTTTASSSTSTFNALTPTRVIDTRSGLNGLSGKLGKGATDSLDVQGLDGIAPNAVAVVANVTVTNTSAAGFITAYGDGGSVPNASNVNFVKGETVANLAVVPVGADGKVDFTNGGTQTGPTDLIVDISGYFTPGTSGLVFHASYPDRILDTRSGIGESAAGVIAKNGTLGLSLGDPGTALYGAGAVIANLTVTGPTGNGFITAYPSSEPLPNVSNVNFVTGETIPNLAFIPNTNGTLDFNNGGVQTGTTNLIVDVSGYFSAS